MEANKFITNEQENMLTQMNSRRIMTDDELKCIFGEGKEITHVDYECLIDSKANVQDVYTKKHLQKVMEAYYGSSPEIANEWYQQEMERRQAELNRQESILNMQNAVDNKISEINETTNNKILEVDNRVNDKISEIDTVVGEKINEMDEKIVEVNSTKEDFTLAINNKISEANNKIDDVENRMIFIEDTFEDLVDGTGFASKAYVDKQMLTKANSSDVYTKVDIDTKLSEQQNKMNAMINDSTTNNDTTWSSNKIYNEIDARINKADVYTKAEVNNMVSELDNIKTNIGHTHTISDINEFNNHGNHVPAYETASNYKFLRCDGSWYTIPNATASTKGVVLLSDSLSSSSTVQAATSYAVKQAYDKAVKMQLPIGKPSSVSPGMMWIE